MTNIQFFNDDKNKIIASNILQEGDIDLSSLSDSISSLTSTVSESISSLEARLSALEATSTSSDIVFDLISLTSSSETPTSVYGSIPVLYLDDTYNCFCIDDSLIGKLIFVHVSVYRTTLYLYNSTESPISVWSMRRRCGLNYFSNASVTLDSHERTSWASGAANSSTEYYDSWIKAEYS